MISILSMYFLGLPCGLAYNASDKNAATQYTFTANGITAAYVCNDGLHWTDGTVVKHDVCDNGQWRPLDYNTTIWENNCTGKILKKIECCKTGLYCLLIYISWDVLPDMKNSCYVNQLEKYPCALICQLYIVQFQTIHCILSPINDKYKFWIRV